MKRYDSGLPPAGLSEGAIRLLAFLRDSRARDESTAVTHAQVTQCAGLPHRDVIDFAAELLAAGYLVLACSAGVYLIEPQDSRPASLAPAWAYAAALKRRAKMVLLRRRRLLRAIDLVESGRAPGCAKMPLFEGVA